MGDNQSSFFSRFYDFGSSKDINFEHVRHKCEPGQKSFVSGLFEKLAKRYVDRRADEAKWTRQRPPATSKGKTDLEDNDVKKDKKVKKEKKEKNEEKEEPPKIDPSQLPTTDDALPRCFIKEQNPFAPPCCEVKTNDEEDDDDGPCPPPGYSQDPRVPSCGCDRCRKSGYHGRCCDQRTFVQQSAEPAPMLEKA